MVEQSTTLFLAVWGAVLSTIAIGWNLFRDLTERGKLRVSCYIGKIVTENVGVDPNDYIVWCITNVGRQPILLTTIGGLNGNKTGFMLKSRIDLPKMLKPGEYVIDHCHELSILGADLKALTAHDSFNRTFKAPRKQIKKMKKEYASGKLVQGDS